MSELTEIMHHLQTLAPLELAEQWDNVGLLAGDPNQQIRKVLLTIDLTRAVLDEAQQAGAELLLTYHPPVFDPLKRVIKGQGASPLLYEVIHSGMAVYTVHTALDAVRGGVNDRLAEVMGIADPQPLKEPDQDTEQLCKLVVFLPESDLEKVSEAIFTAGAGHIGNYSHCSFRVEGTGTFKGDESTNPTVGQVGVLEQAPELRLETIMPVACIPQVIPAMVAAHSYEEPAYDLYPVLQRRGGVGAGVGIGRYGDLSNTVTKKELIETIKQRLGVGTVGVIGPTDGSASRGAVCAGSCGSILQRVIGAGCDFYLTGELNHHNALKLQEAGVATVCVSHSNSERLILRHLAQQLRSLCSGVEFIVSTEDKDPFTWS